ncbi:unnamed protein product [Macrosiphum euphorbiae]|uniref:C2H2-type domain-containing protein n=1 Tax=Macrosiphum euphorbiae TaxID=13131 RepID=A0AAV0Y2L4_9HEMI|nr:unnamed protein product [Macrosiphum euphorbiae]CAI6374656.1 unnamed protein product [Macrosiphum euphorbiae]
MRKCIIKENDPTIGDYFVCTRCKHFMLSTATAEAHKKCTKSMIKTFEPKEQLYRCSSCGRYFEELSPWFTHEKLHKELGTYDPSKFVLKIDENNFVVN